MIVGFRKPVFPRFVTVGKLPTRHLLRLGWCAIPPLRYLERVVHPRWPLVSRGSSAKRCIATNSNTFKQHTACGCNHSDRPRIHRGRRTTAWHFNVRRVPLDRKRGSSALVNGPNSSNTPGAIIVQENRDSSWVPKPSNSVVSGSNLSPSGTDGVERGGRISTPHKFCGLHTCRFDGPATKSPAETGRSRGIRRLTRKGLPRFGAFIGAEADARGTSSSFAHAFQASQFF